MQKQEVKKHLEMCDPIDSSPLGSSVPGILQARALEWVAIAFSEFVCYSGYLLTSCFCIPVPYNEKDNFLGC